MTDTILNQRELGINILLYYPKTVRVGRRQSPSRSLGTEQAFETDATHPPHTERIVVKNELNKDIIPSSR